MSYISTPMNHIQAVKAWVEAHGGQVSLNLLNFELEIKARNRYFHLYPQFLARINGRLCHMPTLSPEMTGFIGWLPYRPMRWALSSDKLIFKRHLVEAGVSAPATWSTPAQADKDFIVKHSVGSFGEDLAGPYRAGDTPSDERMMSLSKPGRPGRVYTEQFVPGHNLKIWFWGERAFHAHLQAYPVVRGDGVRTVEALLRERLRQARFDFDSYGEMPIVLQALAYQQVNLETVLAAGRALWIDFRYGRTFARDAETEAADNEWPKLPPAVRKQIEIVGRFLGQELAKELAVPVLYSLDGVLDNEGKIWWLEMNSNPIFPPTGYPSMLATLFGLNNTVSAVQDVPGDDISPSLATQPVSQLAEVLQ